MTECTHAIAFSHNPKKDLNPVVFAASVRRSFGARCGASRVAASCREFRRAADSHARSKQGCACSFAAVPIGVDRRPPTMRSSGQHQERGCPTRPQPEPYQGGNRGPEEDHRGCGPEEGQGRRDDPPRAGLRVLALLRRMGGLPRSDLGGRHDPLPVVLDIPGET